MATPITRPGCSPSTHLVRSSSCPEAGSPHCHALLTCGAWSSHDVPGQPRRMIRFMLLTLTSLALAIGTTSCAHHQLSKQRATQGAITLAVFAAVITAAWMLPCSECKEADYGPRPSTR